MTRRFDYEPLLKPGEVAKALGIDPKTVTRWANAGKLAAIRLPTGHRRYRESDIRALLQPEGGDHVL